MPSPFPGMDPFLEDERLWPTFHRQLITCLYQILLPSISDRYKARVATRTYDAGQDPSAAAAREEYLEIRTRDEGRVVTVVDAVTPLDKTTPAGRQAYLDARREAMGRGANYVEIDLVRQGQPLIEYNREGLPEWDYAVTVTRATQPERHEIYTSSLNRRLPRFRLPLAADDRDTVMDLQVALTRAYDQGGFAERINYRKDPPVRFKLEDRVWLHEQLREQHLRSGPAVTELSHDDIATAAYYLWLREGCPPGRDREFWFRAIEQLQRGGR